MRIGGLQPINVILRIKNLIELAAGYDDRRVPIVSVGEIMSPEDAKRRLEMGATLVQVYTGLIYHGPGLIKEIVNALYGRPFVIAGVPRFSLAGRPCSAFS